MKRDFTKHILFIMIMSFNKPLFASGYEDAGAFQILLKSLFLIGIFIIVIFVTLYGTKFIAKNYKGYANSKYINLLDTLNIPGGTKIIIIEISKKVYILSLTPNSTEVIDIINTDSFSDEGFSRYLDKYTNKNHNNNNFSINKIIEKINFSKDKEDKK